MVVESCRRVFLGGAVLVCIIFLFSVVANDILQADIMKDRESFWVTKAEWEEQGTRALAKLGRSE